MSDGVSPTAATGDIVQPATPPRRRSLNPRHLICLAVAAVLAAYQMVPSTDLAFVPSTDLAFVPSTERPLPALPLVPVGSCGAMATAAECVICLGEFEGAGEDREAMVKVIPGCRHAFHPECIDRWLRSDASCPLCRCTDLAVVAPLPEDRIRGDGGREEN